MSPLYRRPSTLFCLLLLSSCGTRHQHRTAMEASASTRQNEAFALAELDPRSEAPKSVSFSLPAVSRQAASRAAEPVAQAHGSRLGLPELGRPLIRTVDSFEVSTPASSTVASEAQPKPKRKTDLYASSDTSSGSRLDMSRAEFVPDPSIREATERIVNANAALRAARSFRRQSRVPGARQLRVIEQPLHKLFEELMKPRADEYGPLQTVAADGSPIQVVKPPVDFDQRRHKTFFLLVGDPTTTFKVAPGYLRPAQFKYQVKFVPFREAGTSEQDAIDHYYAEQVFMVGEGEKAAIYVAKIKPFSVDAKLVSALEHYSRYFWR